MSQTTFFVWQTAKRLWQGLFEWCASLSGMKTETEETTWGRIGDAIQYAPISRSQLYNWMSKGVVRSARIGSVRFIDMQSLRQLFERASRQKVPRKISREMRKRAKGADEG